MANAAPTVTIAIPVHKRLDYLPAALACVAAQDHPAIELLVSDNGVNGDAVQDLVRQHYAGPWTFRQNPATVPVVEHLNQLVAAATGEYFVLLCDDDEISPTFVSELVGLLERKPSAHVAIARAATMDERGGARQMTDGIWPATLSADEFVRHWTNKSLRLWSTVTLLARTSSVRACGGYAALPRALYSDNVLLLKLALMGNAIEFGQGCTFTWRIDDRSTGYSASYQEVAGACEGFLHLLDRDAVIATYAAGRTDWPQLRNLLRTQCGNWYLGRWLQRYQHRLSAAEWVRAAFVVPHVPGYYRQVGHAFADVGKQRLKQYVPGLATLKAQLRRARP